MYNSSYKYHQFFCWSKKLVIIVSFIVVGELSTLAQGLPGVITKKKYVHNCPAGTEQVGDGPPKSTVVFCRQLLAVGSQLDGKYTSFYRNGNKKSSGEYLEGKKNGSWTYFTRNGQIRSSKVFKDGNKVAPKNKATNRRAEQKTAKNKNSSYEQNADVLAELRKTRQGRTKYRPSKINQGWPGKSSSSRRTWSSN